MRIVDLDRLELWFEKEYGEAGKDASASVVLKMCNDIVFDATAYWKENTPFIGEETPKDWMCSNCYYETHARHRFCPECGADMLNGVHAKILGVVN